MKDGLIKSASRVLSIFEYFSAVQTPASVAEISRTLDIPQPSTSVLLKNLLQLGYLDYDTGTREYYPSIRLALIGEWVRKEKLPEGRLLRLLDDIRADTGETVVLGFLNGIWTQYIYVLESNAAIRLHLKPGTFRPCVLTSIGNVLLASKTDDEIVKVVRRFNSEQDDAALRISELEFLERMASARANGFAETREALTPGTGMIAMEVPTGNAGVPMGVGVGASLGRLKRNRNSIMEILTGRIKEMADDFETELKMRASKEER